MGKLIIFIASLWLVLFALRAVSIGGIDPDYKEPESDLLLPFRQQLVGIVNQTLPYPQSSLLSGIVLGSQENLPYFFKKQLQTTSTIHIVVVSGQNLTILAGFIASLTSFLGRKKTLALALGVVFFYSVLTGLGVPVIRAAIMVTFTYLAKILGKEGSGWWILLLTAGLMLLYNPNWLLNISFQLSFLATLGVVVVAPMFINHLNIIPRILREDIGVSLAAQLLTLPVIAYNFGQLSLVGILVNALVLWTVPVVMVSGFVVLVAGFLNIFLGQMAGLVPGILLTYFIYIVQFFSKLPGGNISLGETSIVVWLGFYLMLGAGVWMLKQKI